MKQMKRLVLSALALLVAAVPAQAQGVGTVSGIVFDSTAMKPLGGARVAVMGTSVMAEADASSEIASTIVTAETPAGPNRPREATRPTSTLPASSSTGAP